MRATFDQILQNSLFNMLGTYPDDIGNIKLVWLVTLW